MIPVFDPFAHTSVLPVSFILIPIISFVLFVAITIVVKSSPKILLPIGTKNSSGDFVDINSEPANEKSIDKMFSEYELLFSTLKNIALTSVILGLSLCMFQAGYIFNTILKINHETNWIEQTFYLSMILIPLFLQLCLLNLFITIDELSSYYKDLMSYVEYHELDDDFLKYLSSDEAVSKYVSKVASSGRKLTKYEVDYMTGRLVNIKSENVIRTILLTKPIGF